MTRLRIDEILDSSRIVLDLDGLSKEEILRSLSAVVVVSRPEIDHGTLVGVLVQREQASSTAIADGIAIPHGKVALGEEIVAAFGRSRSGLDFESVDGQPTNLFFLLVSPESHPSLHLRWLAHIASLLKNESLRRDLLEAEDPDAVLARIRTEEEAQAGGG